MTGAGEGNRTLLLSVSFRLNACRYAVFRLNRLLVSAQFVTVISTLYRQIKPGRRAMKVGAGVRMLSQRDLAETGPFVLFRLLCLCKTYRV